MMRFANIEELWCVREVMSQPIEECEHRDRKGLYKLAREGEIRFTVFQTLMTRSSRPELSVKPKMSMSTTARIRFC
jgi:sulfate adenylyltransferase